MKLAVIIGHSEAAKGAWSPKLRKHEYDLWSEVALEIYMEAKELGLDCRIFKRNGISIEEVGELVNEFCGSNGVAIELHFNSAAKVIEEVVVGKGIVTKEVIDPQPNGCETLYDSDPAESKLFAQTVHNAMLKALTEPNPNYNEFRKDTNQWSKPKDRGVKLVDNGQRGHRNMRAVKVPSCLVESFFGSNDRDCDRWQRNRAKWVRGLVSAVLTFKLLDK